MRGFLVRGLIATLAHNLLLAVTPAAAGDPQQVVKNVADEVVRILTDPANQGPANKDRRLQLIKNTIERRFDFEEMAKRSLGAAWGKLGSGQRSEFVGIFKELLEASYANRFRAGAGAACLAIVGGYRSQATESAQTAAALPENTRQGKHGAIR